MPKKKTTAKQATAKQATAKQATAKKASARKATAKKASAKKATAKKASAKKATAKKASVKKATAKKATVKKATVKKATAKKGGVTRTVLEVLETLADAARPRAWLMKTEPDTYSIDDLARDGQEGWDGIRNYQARNFMRDHMEVGDLVLVYHSNARPPGVVGLARVCAAARPDPTAFDPESPYFDPRADPSAPRWVMVTVEFVEKFPRMLPLDALRADPAFADTLVVQPGQRLSIQPVEHHHLRRILELVESGTDLDRIC